MKSDLDLLPRITIRATESRGTDLVVKAQMASGSFDLEGPLWFWLWPSDDRAITPTILDGDPESGEVVLSIESGDMVSSIGPGAELPWLSPYWQAYHVYMIRRGEWERRRFENVDAATFTLNGAKGWNKADVPIPEGAVATGIAPGGWDHEHCELCRATIGADGQSFGYVDPADHWLCESCYLQWAVPRDLGFLVE